MAPSCNPKPKIICAICYEEAKPGSEDLQSISLCGHVFHELCLQQWLEYHPAGSKASCPLCKQQCSGEDVHRLYFQSASEAIQSTQVKTSDTADACDDVMMLQDTIQKLTGQLSVAKSALDAYQSQLQDLNQKVSICTVSAAESECALREARKEQISLNDSLSRICQELKACTMERSKLADKNNALMKEIASAKLVQNLDINEEEVTRMAHVGHGNKDDIIGTLTRSLIIRNRAYKDLMAKCNELGICETKAARKAERSVERIRILKARVQELERILEDKENHNLRKLRASSFQTKSIGSPDKHLGTNNLFEGLHGSEPPLPLQSQVMENSSKSTMSSREEQELFTFQEPGKGEQKQYENLEEDLPYDGERTRASGVGSIVKDVEQSLESEIANTCQKPTNGKEYSVVDSLKKGHVPLTIKKEVRVTAGTTCLVTSQVESFASKTSQWCKQSPTDGGTSKGAFISFGANGRGGQVKVLRPPAPMLTFSRVSADVGLRPAKRTKPTPKTGLNAAALQIEHFFSCGR